MLKPLCLALCTLLASTWALAAPRTLDTPYGPVTLQGSPTRVITLDESSLDAALAVGVQPVGTVSTRGSDQVSAYLQERAGQRRSSVRRGRRILRRSSSWRPT